MVKGLPTAVNQVIQRLNEHGYEAYLVGGCVRDILLQRSPKDWDVATGALPEQVMSLFSKTIPTGIKHGTVTVIGDKFPIEITTYRIEGVYLDSRRPSEVSFSHHIAEDLSRRDFTINAMAFHPAKGLVDLYGGLMDLQNKIIRTVRNPHERFEEDALRMLRAVRFAVQLDFEVDLNTFNAMKVNAYKIKLISAERIRDELNKMLLGENVSKMGLLFESDLLKEILPEVNALFSIPKLNVMKNISIGQHTLQALHIAPQNLQVRWAILLHEIGKRYTIESNDDIGQVMVEKLCVDICERLRLDNKNKEMICKLVRSHSLIIDPNEVAIRQAIYKLGEVEFNLLLSMKRATQWSIEINQIGNKVMNLLAVTIIAESVKRKKPCISLKQLAVNGRDLLQLGFSGINVGKLLNSLMQEVLINPELNQKDILIQLVIDQQDKYLRVENNLD